MTDKLTEIGDKLIEGTGELFDKSAQVLGEYFIKLPQDIRNYVYVPGFQPSMIYLYAIIVDRYNADLGYAFPTQIQLALEYGSTPKTVGKHTEFLEKIGLISRISFGGDLANYGYVPIKPLGQDELWRACPEAADAYRKANAAMTKERNAARERAQEWRDKQRTEKITGTYV